MRLLSMAIPEAEAASLAATPHQYPDARRFVATAECADLQLVVETSIQQVTVPLTLSASCMDCVEQYGLDWKKKFQEQVADMSPLQVTSGNSATDLVKDVLIGGDCFDVTNITAVGNARSRGTFSNGSSSLNLGSGVILCTGDVNVLPGPNVDADADGGFNNDTPEDADLKKLASGNQYDLAKIEFDFVPTANTVKFEFVFGSEEYCEFVGTTYNDVFGFFISGPGITGTQNIGLIPNTTTPVTINNVNHTKNTAAYRNNNNGLCGGLPALAINDLELDGFTKVFTATANLQPCQKYHIKLAIADIADEKYCSAVFLKANSFNAGGQVIAEPAYPVGMQSAIENCGQANIKFSRGNGDASAPLPVSFSISPQSTALQGIDFAPIQNNIIIPANETEVLVPVTLFQDGLTEGPEKIVLTINNSCSCTEQRVEFLIEDKPLLDAILADKAICGGTSTALEPTVTGGLLPFIYKWNTGDVGSSIFVTASSTQTYTVTVTDGCGSTEVVSAEVTPEPVPTATLSGSGALCNSGSMANLDLNLTGQSPWVVVWKQNGIDQTQTFLASPVVMPTNVAGIYTLVSVTTQGGCTGTASGSANVTAVNLNLTLDPANPLCHGGNTGSVEASVAGGGTPYTYTWNTGAKVQAINNLAIGTYTVTVTENNGCTLTQTVQLTEPLALSTSAVVKNHINCNNPIGAADLTASGGTPGYQFKWSNNATLEDPTFAAGGNFTVTITDGNNCTATVTVNVTADITPPTVLAKATSQLDCNSDEASLDATGSSSGAFYQFAWSGAGFACCENTYTPHVNLPGVYTLVVTNTQNGCTASASASVTENINLPTALLLNTIPPNCTNSNGSFNVVSVTGGIGPYLYALDGSGNFGTLDQFKNLRPGTHEILVQDANGCEYAETVVFTEVIKPDITLATEVNVAFGETNTLTAELNIPLSLVDTILWSPSEGLTMTKDMRVVIAQPFENTKYTATVISKNGCEDRATVQYRVDAPHIWAPNIFSPNNKDGENDKFYLFSSPNSVRQVVSLQVYDRWGALLFRNVGGSTDSERSGWDGTFHGKMLAPAVFVWCADVELINGERVLLKGDIAIVR